MIPNSWLELWALLQVAGIVLVLGIVLLFVVALATALAWEWLADKLAEMKREILK